MSQRAKLATLFFYNIRVPWNNDVLIKEYWSSLYSCYWQGSRKRVGNGEASFQCYWKAIPIKTCHTKPKSKKASQFKPKTNQI